MDDEHKIDLSVIIPAFNAEKYLDRCLKTVFEAVFRASKGSPRDVVDYARNVRGLAGATSIVSEILVIDNGSGDKTLLVADKWQKEAMNLKKAGVNLHFKVFSCVKTGASATRNLGVSKARGKYIWFIDADDEISSDSISLLIDKAEGTKADLVMMGAERIYADGHRDYLSAVREDKPDFKSRFVRYGAGPWQFLIRRAWWEKCGFSFREGIIHEDMELISSLILFTDHFASVDKPLYFYYQNAGSVLHKTEFNPQIFDIFPALEGLYRRFAQAPRKISATEEFHDELEWFFIWNLLIDSAKDFGAFYEGRAGFSRARKILKEYFPCWRKNRFLREKSLKLRMLVRLNYNRWR